jgi:precorrin-8X/cobalt-precorrin-8 methylmutase
MNAFAYPTDPAEIERRSFAEIRRLTDLSRFDSDQQQVVMRLVHTCGDPSVAADIHFSPGAVTAGLGALQANAPVLCDVEMVRHGINRRYCRGEVLCFLSADAADVAPHRSGETRSMAALAQWRDHLAGAIVAIGNAPTALFRLLELLHEGAPRPALIIGMPVGFISARESKESLLEQAPAGFNVPCITVRGRRGGSTLTAAAVNALARLAQGIRY